LMLLSLELTGDGGWAVCFWDPFLVLFCTTQRCPWPLFLLLKAPWKIEKNEKEII
jgi:hypothetical protein